MFRKIENIFGYVWPILHNFFIEKYWVPSDLCAAFGGAKKKLLHCWHDSGRLSSWNRKRKKCRYIQYCSILHGENFMAIFTTLSVVIWFSTGTLGIFATLVYVFTMRVVINDILSMAIILALSTSILFCNLCYILLWTLSRSVVKIAIRI